MALPERKSQKLERSILKFKEDLNEYKTKHKSISSKILDLTSELLNSKGESNIEVMKNIEDLNYEMDNNILLNLEMIFESIGGFEIDLVDIDSYIPSIKEEQELLRNLEMSAKNLIKTSSIVDNTLSHQERENLNFLYESYKKAVDKTQKCLTEICAALEESFRKVKKMEHI
ncbi:MAG: hypothetical protein ACTSYB_04520 [Candidatus Helarchaeota archaeon]